MVLKVLGPVAPVEEFSIIEDLIFGIAISISWMSGFALAIHVLAEVRQNPAAHSDSINVVPKLKNFRIALLIVHDERLRPLIVSFNVSSPIPAHEVDRNATLGRWNDSGRQ